MIAIRPLDAGDVGLMTGWSEGFFADLKASGDVYFEGAVFDPEAFRRNLVLPYPDGRLGVLALCDGQPAGYMTCRIERPFVDESPVRQVGHVSHVYVAPAFRRRGVARAFLEHAEAWFRGQGIAWMQLSWLPGNHHADATWRAAGFAPYRIHARRRVTSTEEQA